MKQLIRRIIPHNIHQWIIKKRIFLNQKKIYNDVLRRELMYSSTFNNSREAMLSSLMITSHVLEKGLTMPNPRLGFGYDMIRRLIALCKSCVDKFGSDSIEVQSTLADLHQYNYLHKNAEFVLPDDIQAGLNSLESLLELKGDNCYKSNKEDFFKHTKDFFEFANQRHTLRWFSKEEITNDTILKVLKLAQTAPSACNRQATRVKIISDHESIEALTKIQNGNRGFGNMANKWILLTSDQSYWECGQIEMAFTDAGIFAMNLLYSLHYYGIAACTLNAHLSPEKQEQLRKVVGYPDNEIPCLFIAIGYPPADFKIARSRRLNVENIVTFL